MIRRSIILLTVLAAKALAEPLDLSPGTQLELADAATGAKLLGASDAYFQRMSPFDRAARMRVVEPPSQEEFARHAAENARDFSDADRTRMQAALEQIRPLLEPLHLSFPAHITIVKTNGQEDINEPYCRGPVIVLPEKTFASPGSLTRTLLHELFHVFSTHHPELRDRLYALLDYQHCPDLALPPLEDARRFTNPDAMRYDYYTILNHEGREVAMTPVLLARHEKYDPAMRGDIFSQVGLLLVELDVHDGKAAPVLDSAGRVVTHEAAQVPAYLQHMARNTGYILHPEEVLADNFVFAVRKTTGLPAPELPARLLEIMQSATPR